MYLKITIISLLISICYVMSSKIGNYSQTIANYENCGLSWNSLLMNSQCFENRYDFSSPIKGGRYAQIGEVPWMVHIYYNDKIWFISSTEYSCGGSLLSNEWVLTAAHCLENHSADRFYVYTDLKDKGGKYTYASKKFLHPEFGKSKNWGKYDIGLLKLISKLPIELTNDYQSRGTICLPVKSFRIKEKKYARAAGFGPLLSHLQTTTYSVKEGAMSFYGLPIASLFLGNQICKGDSGSPIWMYENGRAFQIGVTATLSSSNEDQCSNTGRAAYVPLHIDWILKIMVNE